MSSETPECYISVDVETAGPVPGVYSLLSIGACLVEDDTCAFGCQLKPTSQTADPKALEVSGFSLEQLSVEGIAPAKAMTQFLEWVRQTSGDRTPVFVGLNAAFDWSFVNYYFHVYLGHNPFGFAPLDIKAFYMGATGATWRESRSSRMTLSLNAQLRSNHDALTDARAQAEIFRLTQSFRAKL